MVKTEWTISTLKEYTDARFLDNSNAISAALAAQKEALSAALAATNQAIHKADTATEKRFEESNEFRKQLREQTATFIPRTEADQQFEQLTERITKSESMLTSLSSNLSGKSSVIGPLWAVGGAILGGVVISLFTMYMHSSGK